MLVAFAIETLCKGALIRGNLVDAQDWDGSGIPRELRSHDLTKLVRSVGMQIDEGEEYTLAQLGRAALWSGRYPFAATYHPAIHTVSLPGGRKFNAASYGEGDLSRAEALIAKLRKHLRVRRRYTTSRDAAP
ncbi:MAG TPA: hypothetical protein VE967_09185 [Gemmatimonadaceae bacterium]|nr:hypothetical protein [Gemmatimonadaceae bacterium]